MPDDNDILKLARERFSEASDYERDNHEAAREAVLFRVGDQWPDAVIAERKNERRPMLTVNKLNQFVNHVVNTQRQNRPGIKVRPSDAGDVEGAQIREGLIRSIEQCSHAEGVYDNAFEQAVEGGFGFWRIVAEYEEELSFNQVLRIKRVRNRFSVVYDPHAQDFLKRDARFCFVHEEMPKDEFERQYPDVVAESWPSDTGGAMADWVQKNSVRVAEYFVREHENVRIALFSDGRTIEVPEKVDGKKIKEKEFVAAYEQNSGTRFVRSRTAKKSKIRWYKLTGFAVLETKELPVRFIPVVPVYGSVTNVAGRDVVRGLVHPMMDSQRMYNYWVTHATEMIALAPKAPFMATAKQIGDYAQMWKQANHKNLPYLLFTPDADSPGAPQRVPYPSNPTGVVNMAMMASSELNETSSLHPPVLGKKSNETSGVAIEQRQQQGETATFHYQDNLSRAIAYTGEILLDWMPHVYDSARVVQILGEDGRAKAVRINEMFRDADGKTKNYDMAQGRYEAHAEAGPSFASKRQEMATFMLEAFKINPQMFQIAGDILFRNLDMQGAEELAQRLSRIVPPQVKGEKAMTQPSIGVPPGALNA